MKLVVSIAALVATATLLLVDAEKRPTSYRRNLSPFTSVCFGTLPPSPAPVTPTIGGTPSPTKQGGSLAPVVSKSPNGYNTQPAMVKTSAPKTPTYTTPKTPPTYTTPKNPPTYTTPKSPPTYTTPKSPSPDKTSPSKPSPSKSSSYSKSSPDKSSPSKNSPSKSGPSKSGPSKSGPSKSSPSKSSGGPSGYARALKFAAAALGFDHEEQPSDAAVVASAAAQLVFPPRELQGTGTGTPLNTTFQRFGNYPLPGLFNGFALLAFPNECFGVTLDLNNFIPNCVNCLFVIHEGPGSCTPPINPVIPYVDGTEVSFNPFVNATFFNTDATGRAFVEYSQICTGNGPVDNFERPFLLLDSTGRIAACGVTQYACP